MPCKRLNSRLGKVPQWTATCLICWGSLSITFFTLTSFLSLRYIFFRSSTTFSGAKSSSLSMHPPSKDRFVSPLLPFLEQTLGVQKYFVVLQFWVWIYFVAVIFLIWLALVFVLAESWGIENLRYYYVFPLSSFCRLWCFHPCIDFMEKPWPKQLVFSPFSLLS